MNPYKTLSDEDIRYKLPPRVGSKNPRGKRAPRPPGFKDTLLSMYLRDGKTLQEIGDEFGITRERVRQILSKFEEYRRYRAEKRLGYNKSTAV